MNNIQESDGAAADWIHEFEAACASSEPGDAASPEDAAEQGN